MIDTPLEAGLWLGLIGLLTELLAMIANTRTVRTVGYCGALILTAFSATALVANDLNLATVLVAFVAAYRIFNDFRALSRRHHERRTLRVTRRSSYYLIFYQLVTLGFWYLYDKQYLTTEQWLYGLLGMAFAMAFILMFVTRHNLKKTAVRPTDKAESYTKLPTVSVCVPARNETSDLPLCLDSILASDYPKLEIVVLDDCSHDKTSEIIKKLAQKGVRFIKGEEPKNGWLAKNQAYQQLAEAATGDILLFCGVDVRFGSHDISTLVDTLKARHKQMISVLPKGLQTDEHASLVQPMRYWWELALPRRIFNRPPVLSTCWLIYKDTLHALGGLKAVDNAVIPEGYFARELATVNGYSFIRNGNKLALASVKTFDSQQETAVRVRYPQLRKRPEMVMLTTLAEIWLFLFPLALFFYGFWQPLGSLGLLAGATIICLLIIHYMIIKAWSLNKYALPLATFPVAALIDVVILNYSMWRYEFSTVTWKERNICIPVMQTFKHLPRV